MHFETLAKQRKYILITSIVGIIALFLPFVSFGGMLTVNAINYGGVAYLILLGFLLSGAVCFTHHQTEPLDDLPLLGAVAGGGTAAAILIFHFFQFLDFISFIGIGFYLSILSSIAIIYLAFGFKEKRILLETEESTSIQPMPDNNTHISQPS